MVQQREWLVGHFAEQSIALQFQARFSFRIFRPSGRYINLPKLGVLKGIVAKNSNGV